MGEALRALLWEQAKAVAAILVVAAVAVALLWPRILKLVAKFSGPESGEGKRDGE